MATNDSRGAGSVGLAPCFYCGEPVEVRRTAWRRIEAWERKGTGRTRRSGADVAARTYFDEWACDGCVDRIRRGVPLGQGSLL